MKKEYKFENWMNNIFAPFVLRMVIVINVAIVFPVLISFISK